MKKVDMIVSAPHFFTMKGEGVGYLADAAMAVDKGEIIAVGKKENILKEYSCEERIDKPHHVILPGLIDAHIHSDIGILRGLAQDTKHWMMYGLSPFSNSLDAKTETLGGRLCYLEALRTGTTTFGDFSENIEDICNFVEEIGVRACLTPEVRDAAFRIYAPGELYEFDMPKGEKSLEENIRVFDKWNGAANGRIRIFFGPQGADFCSLELLQNIKREALKRKTKIHMHVQQGDRETYQIMARYGKRPIAWLDEIGYLDSSLLAVHLTDADEAEVRHVAAKGVPMVVCPGSIAIIDGIVPPSVAFQDAGGVVALGSDQAPGNNCHNIFNEMKLVALFNKIKYQDPEVMPAWKALRMATIEGAEAMGMAEAIGSLEEGKRGDFIAVDLNSPNMMPIFTEPMRNIVPNLVYSARGNEVSLVVVDGRILFHEGEFLTMDPEKIKSDAQQCVSALSTKAADKFWAVNGTNAEFMRGGKL